MAKGTGLIGNFRGKVGNMVGYNLKDSNNKQTQGVRVYQPIVKNPKTYAQAEQRAKLLAVNATYRALKMVIDRGNEGLPYGNKSRLAWLKKALKASMMPWYEKGSSVNMPVFCELSQGSLVGFNYTVDNGNPTIHLNNAEGTEDISTIGKLSAVLKASNPALRDGDQLTYVLTEKKDSAIQTTVKSFVIDTTSSVAQTDFKMQNEGVFMDLADANCGFAVIVSRLGDNGEHLRSSASLVYDISVPAIAPYDADSKAAAIASYRTSGAASGDWAEESIQ